MGNSFKRLKKQALVYDYCKDRIKKGEMFNIKDISKDLDIALTTTYELVEELSNKYNDFTYDKGTITILGIGNSKSKNNKGVTVKDIKRTTCTRIEKVNRVYKYLVALVNEGKTIPNLSTLHNTAFTDMHTTTLMEVLKDLDRENKIIYQRGNILGVNVPSVRGDREKEYKANKQEQLEINIPVKEVSTKFVDYVEITKEEADDAFTLEYYDKAVKEVIADYILNANITTSEEIIEYVNAITKITDKIKNKLMK